MRVRKLDANNDMQFGSQQSNFWKDVPDAPAQCAETRLWFWQGQWFLDITDGTPYATQILGERTVATRDPAIQARILGTQGILQINSYSSTLNPTTRGGAVQATVDTIYGTTDINTVLT